MIGYATIGSSDVQKSVKFYCDLFEEQGAKVVIDADRIVFIGTERGQPMLAICTPWNKETPEPGNGTMISFPAGEKPVVDALYAKAMSLGAADEGAPGQRVPDRFYGAYVRDPDGNKLCFYVFG